MLNVPSHVLDVQDQGRKSRSSCCSMNQLTAADGQALIWGPCVFFLATLATCIMTLVINEEQSHC